MKALAADGMTMMVGTHEMRFTRQRSGKRAAPHAEADCEFRYFDEKYKPELMEKIQSICAVERVPGVKTTATFGASHPAIGLNEKGQRLLDITLEISREQGQRCYHEKTGGAGDIRIAGQAGIGVLDGLGLTGEGMHTVNECVDFKQPAHPDRFCSRDDFPRDSGFLIVSIFHSPG